MENTLCLEERTVGFFLKRTDNVTCYGPAARENIIPVVGQDDYTILRDNVPHGGVLEHPQKEPYINLVERNPFLGLTGEEAYTIHRFLLQTSADDFSLRTGLITYAGAPGEYGIYPFF